MTDLYPALVIPQLKALLKLLREEVGRRGWDMERLPNVGDLGSCSLRVHRGHDNLCTESVRWRQDRYQWNGYLGSDVSLLLECPDYPAAWAALKTAAPRKLPILFNGDRTDRSARSRSAIKLTGVRPSFCDCGRGGYHPPVMLSEMVVELLSAPEWSGSVPCGRV
jgi:hypothetical protein